MLFAVTFGGRIMGTISLVIKVVIRMVSALVITALFFLSIEIS